MSTGKTHLNEEVTALLDQVHHSSRAGIDRLRNIILSTDETLTENIKWNGPNYSVGGEDRITMKIHPVSRPIQLIFHRGAKKLKQPKDKLITHESKMLAWKENDRAIITFKSLQDIENGKAELAEIVAEWISATK